MKPGKDLNEVVVGAFVAGVFVLLAFFTIVISGVEIGGGRRRLDVFFTNVGNLKPHDSVIVRGVPVGQVRRLKLVDGEVRVELALTQDVRMRDGYTITVVPNSLLGGHYLLVDPGSGAELPAHAHLVGKPPHDLVQDISEAVASLRHALSSEGELGTIRRAADSLAELMGRLERGEGTLGKLLSKDESIYTNLAATVASIRTVAQRLEQGQGSVGKLLADDGRVYDDLRTTAENLKSITARAESGQGTLGKLLSADDSLYTNLAATASNLRQITDRVEQGQGTLGRLLAKNDSVYTNLEASAASLRTVLARLENGEGTLGKLSKDEALYTDVKGLVGDARQTLDGIRETTPVTTFTSILMGGL